jgi:hypothetical protein
VPLDGKIPAADPRGEARGSGIVFSAEGISYETVYEYLYGDKYDKNDFVVFLLPALINFSFGKDKAVFDGTIVPSVADRDLDFWVYSTSEYGPHIPLVQKVYQNEPIMLLMFVRAHPAGVQSQLDITYDLKMVREDKSTSLIAPNNYFYKGKVINGLIMPNNVSTVWFDKKGAIWKIFYHGRISREDF